MTSALTAPVEIPGTGVISSPLGPVYGYHFNGNSNYHALIAKFEKRFSRGFTLLTSYTLVEGDWRHLRQRGVR